MEKELEGIIKNALNCSENEFNKKYKAYKKASEEFNAILNPFKENLLKLYEDNNVDIPKSITIGDAKFTYVAPSIRNSIDSKKLKEEEPEIAQKYTKNTIVKANIRMEDLIKE